MSHALTLGSVLLTDSVPDSTNDFVFNVLADGMSFGVASPVQEVVKSLLADGDLVRITRAGNREVSFSVEISGPTLASLADGEAALGRQVGGINTLTWQPPDDLAPASVFQVLTSSMSQRFDDLSELRNRRVFDLTLTCAPFAFSTKPATISELVSGSTTLSVDTCDSATGWTGKRNGVPTTTEGPSTIWEAGAVGILELSNTEGFPPETWEMTRTGSVDFSTTPYLVVELTTLTAKAGGPLIVDVYAIVAGQEVLLPPLEIRKVSDGTAYFRLTMNATNVAGATALRFRHVSSAGYGHAWQGLSVRDIKRSDAMPSVTARQVSRIVEVEGTERSVASLLVKSPTSSDLSHTLVATYPEMSAGFSPPMRRWRSNGNTVVADAATISGSREAIGPTAVNFGVPASSIPPGAYQLAGRLRTVGSTGSLNIYWEAGTSVQGVLLTGKQSGSLDWSFPVLGQWEIVPLGTVSLPVIAATNGDLFIGINHAGSSQVEFDELWLFPIGEDCAVSGANVTATRFWCDAPAPGEANPALRIGNTDDRSNARSPGLSTFAKGLHVMRPGRMCIFAATTVNNPMVSGSLPLAWHSNAAK